MLLSLNIIILGAAIFFLPGYALLALVNPDLNTDPIERLSLGLGLSLAVIPLSLYLSTLFGLQQSPMYVSIFLLLAGAVAVWDLYRRWRIDRFASIRLHWKVILPFVLIFLLALVARLQGVAGLDFPLWTDSYHHTLIAQIISDGGLVPSSYEPYAPIHDFSYHFGFHTLVAWFHWLTRIPVPRSVVLVGQIVNALVVPTIYVIAKRLWKVSTVGLVASLILGLLSHMPAFFVNWGRYTQLTGQILLPITIALYIYSIEKNGEAIRTSILAGISLAGLFLTHNRVTIFALILSATFALFYTLRKKSLRSALRNTLVTTSIFLAVAAVIDLGWIRNFIEVFGNRIAGMFQAGYSEADFGRYFEWSASYLTEFGAHLMIWLLAAMGLIWGIAKRDRGVIWILSGSGIIFLLALSYLIGLPGLYSVLIVIIWLNLPLALLAAYFINQILLLLLSFIPAAIPRLTVFRIVAFTPLVLAAIIGGKYIRDLTLPENGFVRGADLRAMEWIDDHTRENALFYISTRFWTPHVAHGLDGGYWIPYFTGRPTTMPPQTYAGDAEPSYMNDVNARAHTLTNAASLENLHNLLITYGVDYIYIGERKTELDPNTFLSAPKRFTPLYHNDGVWIFKVIDNIQAVNDRSELV